jgi:hypothetical protein
MSIGLIRKSLEYLYRMAIAFNDMVIEVRDERRRRLRSPFSSRRSHFINVSFLLLRRAINFQIEETFNNHYDSLIKSITIENCLMNISVVLE